MIPLSEPSFEGHEWKYLKACLDSGWVSAAGPLSEQLERVIQEQTGAGAAVAVASGTAALHLSLLAAGVMPGDLVLVSDYSFIASANVIRYCQADPVFMEVDPHTWQANPDAVAEWLETECHLTDLGCYHQKSGRKVSACILVHAMGRPADTHRMLEVLHPRGIVLIEDAAGALGSRIGNQQVGTLADFGTISLNGNKIITAGGGGIVLCRDAAQARVLHHLSRQAKVAGTAYRHDAVGYNYRLPDLMAALALAQLEQLPEFLRRKQALMEAYRATLPEVQWQEDLDDTTPNSWMIAFRTPHRQALLQHLHQAGIQAGEGWYPLHAQPPYQNSLFAGDPAPGLLLGREVVCLPASVGMDVARVGEIAGKIREGLGKK